MTMTDTIEVSNVLNKEGIESQRALWQSGIETIRARHTAILEEIPKLQLQEAALNGAIQACDIFINLIESNASPVSVNLVPTNQ